MNKRYGVIYGLNYTQRPELKLNGCHNDAGFWSTQMQPFEGGFLKQLSPNNTCATMESMLVEQLSKAQEGDHVYVTFSGHGTYVPPGIQSWVPDDFDWNNPKTWFTYDKLDHLLLQHEKRGVIVVVISDSCHSRADPRLHFRSLGMNPHPTLNRFLPPPEWIDKKVVADPFNRNVITADQDDLLLSGCQKKQTSADAWIAGQYWGAFTYALSLVLKAGRPVSYQRAVLQARAWLAQHGYSQVPSADGDPMSLQLPFFGVPGSREVVDEEMVETIA